MKLLVALLFVPLTARAGDFCGDDTGPNTISKLEHYRGGRPQSFDVDCIAQWWNDAVPAIVQVRVVAACTKVVAIAKKKRDADLDLWCTGQVMLAGTGQVGDRDLVAEVIAKGGTWDAWAPYGWLAATGDARVRPFVLAQLADHQAAWKKRKRHPLWARDLWLKNEVDVVDALAKVGTRDDLAIVEAIATEHPKDKRVIRATAAARAALDK
jgi:hypothetical protein